MGAYIVPKYFGLSLVGVVFTHKEVLGIWLLLGKEIIVLDKMVN